jgi:CMP-N-acetylneuraminic acid synthetase
MPKEGSVDIDTELDFKFAEFLISQQGEFFDA